EPEPEPEARKDAPKKEDTPKAEAKAAPADDEPAEAPKAPANGGSGQDLSAPVDADGVRVKASPLARRIAADRGIDLTTVEGSGPHGRIVERDLEGLEKTRVVRAGASGRAARASREDEVVRVSQMRKTIAKRLVESKQSAPHYYLTMHVDCDALVQLRKDVNAAQDAVKISYNDLVLRACTKALLAHPNVNVAWEGATIRRFGGVHLAFAVALDTGLISPVVRDADQLGLIDLALAVRELAEKARAQKLDSADYTGASFTVSNLGMAGVDAFTAIINPPAACILAVGALNQVPVVKDGQLAVGHRMTITLSCDHRAVDGAVGAAFLGDVRKALESPVGLLL
ncbi:MAG: 2-oxo acid dehydrogenase subunit E2, partial [Myxococcales bacterium]|nr:2-oxo acid dehydrogenase subunit E2 [Myxococcales bacterium]